MYIVCIYTIVRGRIKGAACGHIGHIHRAAATAGTILLSQGCIFQQQGSILHIAESGVYIWQIIHNCSTEKRKIFFVFAMEWPIPPSLHYWRATANIIEPPYSVLAQQPKCRTNFPGYWYSDTVLTWCVEPRTAEETLLFPGS